MQVGGEIFKDTRYRMQDRQKMQYRADALAGSLRLQYRLRLAEKAGSGRDAPPTENNEVRKRHGGLARRSMSVVGEGGRRAWDKKRPIADRAYINKSRRDNRRHRSDDATKTARRETRCREIKKRRRAAALHKTKRSSGPSRRSFSRGRPSSCRRWPGTLR